MAATASRSSGVAGRTAGSVVMAGRPDSMAKIVVRPAAASRSAPLLGHPLPDVGSVDAGVVAGDVDPRPMAGELVAVPDDVVVQRHQGTGDEVVCVDGVGPRRHGRVVPGGD